MNKIIIMQVSRPFSEGSHKENMSAEAFRLFRPYKRLWEISQIKMFNPYIKKKSYFMNLKLNI